MAAPITKEQFAQTLATLVERAWESAREEMRVELLQKLSPPNQQTPIFRGTVTPSPQKRGAQGRAEHGSIKKAVRRTVYDHPKGIKRADMFRYAREKLGVEVKSGSMKQAIRILRLAKDIHNRDGKWFPSRDE